jgi:hypothetical protein
VSSQAQCNRVKQPWTETMSQNKYFHLLSQVFCHNDGNLTNTLSNTILAIRGIQKYMLKEQIYMRELNGIS